MRQATFHNAASAGTARRGSSPDLRHRLLLHLASRRRGAGHLSDGFTLIELMIVIVIVAILMAIALPNFLNQTAKAKVTEAKTLGNASAKEAQAAWAENGADGITNTTNGWAVAQPTGSCPTATKNFTFGCTHENLTLTTPSATTPPTAIITATGTSNSGDLLAKTVIVKVNLANGRLALCGTAPTLPADCSFT